MEGRGLVTLLILDPPQWEAISSSLNCPKLRGAKRRIPHPQLVPELNFEILTPVDQQAHLFIGNAAKYNAPSLGPRLSVLCTFLSFLKKELQ